MSQWKNSHLNLCNLSNSYKVFKKVWINYWFDYLLHIDCHDTWVYCCLSILVLNFFWLKTLNVQRKRLKGLMTIIKITKTISSWHHTILYIYNIMSRLSDPKRENKRDGYWLLVSTYLTYKEHILLYFYFTFSGFKSLRLNSKTILITSIDPQVEN